MHPDQPNNQTHNVVINPQVHPLVSRNQPLMPHPQPAQAQSLVTHGRQQNNLNYQQPFIPNTQPQNVLNYPRQVQPQNNFNQPPLPHSPKRFHQN